MLCFSNKIFLKIKLKKLSLVFLPPTYQSFLGGRGMTNACQCDESQVVPATGECVGRDAMVQVRPVLQAAK